MASHDWFLSNSLVAQPPFIILAPRGLQAVSVAQHTLQLQRSTPLSLSPSNAIDHIMSELLDPLIYFYRTVLNPMQPLSSWVGSPITMLDLGAAFRLCMFLRQSRELLRTKHIEATAKSDKTTVASLEQQSFVRHASTALLVVYGGEAITGEHSAACLLSLSVSAFPFSVQPKVSVASPPTAPYLGITPSFMVSGVIPLIYIGMQAVIEFLAEVQPLTLSSELPLALIDGLTRAYLLCNLIPPAVLTHSSNAVAQSPWTLLLTALVRVRLTGLPERILQSIESPPINSPRVSLRTDYRQRRLLLRQHLLVPPALRDHAHHSSRVPALRMDND